MLLLSLPLLTAQSCPSQPSVMIRTPKPGMNVTFEPLYLAFDVTVWADPQTLLVTLNGTDITSEFPFGEPVNGRRPASAVDVFGDGLVLPGQNVLVVATDLGAASATFTAEGDPHADAVTSFTPGPGAGYGQTELPDVVTGGPEGLGLFDGGLDVLALGEGGVIVLEFVDNVVVDYPGPDFTVFENAFYTLVSGTIFSVFAEPALVSVSQNGTDWFDFDACDTAPVAPPYFPGCAGVFPTLADPLDPEAPHPSIPTGTPVEDLIGLSGAQIFVPEGAGGDSFDLADTGLTWARYVRIEDVGPALGQSGTVGFDLDAVTAVSSAPPTDADLDGVPDAAP